MIHYRSIDSKRQVTRPAFWLLTTRAPVASVIRSDPPDPPICPVLLLLLAV